MARLAKWARLPFIVGALIGVMVGVIIFSSSHSSSDTLRVLTGGTGDRSGINAALLDRIERLEGALKQQDPKRAPVVEQAVQQAAQPEVVKEAHVEDSHEEIGAKLGKLLHPAYSHDDLDKMLGPNQVMKFDDEHAHHDDSTVADELTKRVRILCWVLTSPDNLDKKAIHVRATWGKRCNILLFMSSVTNDSFPTIGLDVPEGREHLTGKTIQAFKYVYEHYLDQADWFMKADDDTYVILENLRYFLMDKNPSDPVYFGHHFQTIVKQGYFSGGGGYVLSKEALKRFAAGGYNHSEICRQDGGAEDAEFGFCMERLGVKTGYSIDALGHSRFHCFDPETHILGGYPDWYYKYDAQGGKKDVVSDYAITFHYIPPQRMYALEFYVYHLRPFGIISQAQKLNVPG